MSSKHFFGFFGDQPRRDPTQHVPNAKRCCCDDCVEHEYRKHLAEREEAEEKKRLHAEAMRDHKQAVVDKYIDNELRRMKLLAELNAVSQDILLARHTLREFVPPAESAYFNHSTSDAKVIVSRQITLAHLRDGGQPQRRIEVVVNGFTIEEKANG